MFRSIASALKRLAAASQQQRGRRRPTSRSVRLSLEDLEGRLTPSHVAVVLPHEAASAVQTATAKEEQAAAAAQEHAAAHSTPADVEARLAALAAEEAKLKATKPSEPSIPAPIEPVRPAPAKPSPAPSSPKDPLPGGGGGVVDTPPPAPTPAPYRGPGTPVNNPGINPATYIPDLCTTASFSGTMGANGYYSSFTIVGHNTGTGTTVIISYNTGTPYGTPVYHWQVTVDSTTLGNWGNQATVYEPYNLIFLPVAVTNHQPVYGPG